MSGPVLFLRPRRPRRGAALTSAAGGLVLAGTLLVSGASGTTDAALHDRPPSAAERPAGHGDRWTAVYDARAYEAYERALAGQYSGIGLSARRTRDGAIEVERVQPGGPADRAGIRAGDRLDTVDARGTARRPVTEVVSRLRGAQGTRVTLGLTRGDRSWTRTLSRARLTTPNVVTEPAGPDAVRIRVTAFTAGAGTRLRDAVAAAPPGAGVLLDLRGNSGGLVTEAREAASVFLDGGLVATYGVRGEQRALYAEPGGDTGRPVVVLVDGGTMSAAELLAGALQDRGRAVVVGSPTFGKGSVQMPTRLPDGSVAELTVGHYSTPAGREVDGVGITPDLTATRERAVTRARAVLGGLGGAP
ncbi:S41 family peptidase [Streptomyces sp. NPDC060194]|uniref:S41 family peptidase n=1 Tax=Streptomyces sp. NPDC060194 TaxID=3347069 RepID=UPI003668C9C0